MTTCWWELLLPDAHLTQSAPSLTRGERVLSPSPSLATMQRHSTDRGVPSFESRSHGVVGVFAAKRRAECADVGSIGQAWERCKKSPLAHASVELDPTITGQGIQPQCGNLELAALALDADPKSVSTPTDAQKTRMPLFRRSLPRGVSPPLFRLVIKLFTANLAVICFSPLWPASQYC